MQTLTQNTISIFGERGKNWLDKLPDVIATLADYWHLHSIVVINNMSFNYVAKASKGEMPVVLKIGCDPKVIADERQALEYFSEFDAAIRLIDYNKQYNAMLLQRAIPGTSLKSLYPSHEKFVINCYVDVVQKLLAKPLPNRHNFRHISDWLKAVDRLKPEQLPPGLLLKALELKKSLLLSMRQEVVLHGDLHHDNILDAGDIWLAIDPKGIIGEPEFEVAAFDFIHNSELAVHGCDVRELFWARLKSLAEISGLDCARIHDWVFVRLVLAFAWAIEDNIDPAWHLEIITRLF